MGRSPCIRRLLSLTLATFAVACAGAPAASALPTQGVFEKCPLATALVTCVSRLSAISAGGVRVVVFSPRAASLDELATYAASAQSAGISVMWSIGMPDWWKQPLTSTQLGKELPAFATACGCQTNQALFAYMVSWLRALPATYGYYAADDTSLNAADDAGIAAYMARLKQLDPVHPALMGSFNQYLDATYQPMADMLGQEIYPVVTNPILPASANQATWSNVAATAAYAQASADAAGKPSAFILQAFTWGDNLSDGMSMGACTPSDTIYACYARLRYPSAAEQLALRNTVLDDAHPALILWYSFPGTYGSAAPENGTLYPSGADAAARWSGLSTAIQAPWTQSAPTAVAAAPPASSSATSLPPTAVPKHNTRSVCRASGRRASRRCGRHRHRRHHRHHHRRHHR